MIEHYMPCFVGFLVALALTLVLTPIVREMNRRLGMVDKPDARRINKVPIPRGGGLALFLGVTVTVILSAAFSDVTLLAGSEERLVKLMSLSAAMVAIGYADDKFSLPPRLKLLGQLAVAAATWFWADLGFRDIWPALPAWIDCAITVFWIAGAVNAFNLIDGLDGLASGLALIATCGMAGCLILSGHGGGVFYYFVFAGGLLGFLFYNYNPASVFLGDSGSMFIGYLLAVLPLCSHAQRSFLVSVGVPLLAMGVPIFDTSLAILRRSVRHLLRKEGEDTGNDRVMTADTDHLHHRILRSFHFDQRKAAWTLYACAAFLVGTGIVSMTLKSRSAGLWLAAVAVGVTIAFRDMARVELLDVGLLLDRVAHSPIGPKVRAFERFLIPIGLVCDFAVLAGLYVFCCWVLQMPITAHRLRTALVIRVAISFGCLVFFRTYVTSWSRAMTSNYLRLFLALTIGSILGTVCIYYFPYVPATHYKAMTILYAVLPFMAIMTIRIVRLVVRDLFYVLTCRQLILRKDVERLLVYGTGLRYRAFRRELVRSTASSNRVIIGLIDDNPTLRGQYIGGTRVMGALEDVPRIVNNLRIDAVVVAFEASEERLKEIYETLKPCGVKVTNFTFVETTLKGE